MSGETDSEQSSLTPDLVMRFVDKQLSTLEANHTARLDSAIEALTQRIEDQRLMLDERYATSVKALDAAFKAQQLAMETAFTAADKAVQAALSSAEKAVTKAESAAEKRFESVNEFRAQLTDQAATFLSRSEGEIRFSALAERLDTLTGANAIRLTEVERRLNLTQGKASGANTLWGYIVGGIGTLIAIIAIVLSVVLR